MREGRSSVTKTKRQVMQINMRQARLALGETRDALWRAWLAAGVETESQQHEEEDISEATKHVKEAIRLLDKHIVREVAGDA